MTALLQDRVESAQRLIRGWRREVRPIVAVARATALAAHVRTPSVDAYLCELAEAWRDLNNVCTWAQRTSDEPVAEVVRASAAAADCRWLAAQLTAAASCNAWRKECA